MASTLLRFTKVSAPLRVDCASLTENLETSWATMLELRRAGISMKEVADKLLEDGIRQFETAFSQLLRAIDSHAEPHSPLKIKGQTIHLC
jgi:transaldolase